MPLGKHFRQRAPYFTDVIVEAKETPARNLHPQIVRQRWRGRSMAAPTTTWQRPPSLRLQTNMFMLGPHTDFSDLKVDDLRDYDT